MNEIDVSDIPEGLLLAALYNNSVVQGMGRLAARPGIMTEEQATELLTKQRRFLVGVNAPVYFDYLFGKVMKVWIGKPKLATNLYDRDLGNGAAALVVQALRIVLKAKTPEGEPRVDF